MENIFAKLAPQAPSMTVADLENGTMIHCPPPPKAEEKGRKVYIAKADIKPPPGNIRRIDLKLTASQRDEFEKNAFQVITEKGLVPLVPVE